MNWEDEEIGDDVASALSDEEAEAAEFEDVEDTLSDEDVED